LPFDAQKKEFYPVYYQLLLEGDIFIYLSIQESEQKGWHLSPIEDDKNGLYKIELSTGKTNKISNQTYDELYLMRGDRLGDQNRYSC
jgi:hypothetical protein